MLIIFWDTEYTAWEGSLERNWSGDREFKEIVQIGAVKYDSILKEITGEFSVLVKPKINPVLSDYMINLTGISRQDVLKSGLSLDAAWDLFKGFTGNQDCYSWGCDHATVMENFLLYDQKIHKTGRFFNLREIFKEVGLNHEINSGALAAYYDPEMIVRAHDAKEDARSLAYAYKYLFEKGLIKL